MYEAAVEQRSWPWRRLTTTAGSCWTNWGGWKRRCPASMRRSASGRTGAEAYHNRGVSLGRMARGPAQALTDFDRAIRLAPNYAEAWRSLSPHPPHVWANPGGVGVFRADLENSRCGAGGTNNSAGKASPCWAEPSCFTSNRDSAMRSSSSAMRPTSTQGAAVCCSSANRPPVPLFRTCPGADEVFPQGSPRPPHSTSFTC